MNTQELTQAITKDKRLMKCIKDSFEILSYRKAKDYNYAGYVRQVVKNEIVYKDWILNNVDYIKVCEELRKNF